MDKNDDRPALFEIFQEDMDLEEEQDSSEEKEEKQDQSGKDENEEKEEGKDPSGETDKPEQKEEDAGTETGILERERKENQKSDPPNQSTDTKQTEQAKKQRQSMKDEPSSERERTETETGSYIKQLEEEKALEGKIVLSRGAAVLLLLFGISGFMGAYFIGLQGAQNNETAISPGQEQEHKSKQKSKTSPKSTALKENNLPKKSPSSSPENDTDSQSQNTQSENAQEKTGGSHVQKTYYTIGLIAYSENKEKSLKKIREYYESHAETLENNGISTHGKITKRTGNDRMHWVVTQRVASREKAEKIKSLVRQKLSNVNKSYRYDIMEITYEEAKNIK